MLSLVPWIRLAGAIQILDAAANLALPRKIKLRDDLRRLSPLARQIMVVHWAYIIFVLLVFGGLCVWFAPELAGATPLGRFLGGALAIFWLPRAFIQVFYFDRDFRAKNRFADLAFISSSFLLGVVFTLAALGFGR